MTEASRECPKCGSKRKDVYLNDRPYKWYDEGEEGFYNR
jgi:hypothetical protein